VAGERPELGSELAVMMLDNETSPALRVELAALLRDHHLLSPDLLDRLTNLDQPGPMRLFAAELMLRINPHDPDGIDVLRGLARQPNRELAVQIASVLQNVLGLNVGVPEGQLPASNSKEASDLARRVLAWANGANPDILNNLTPGPRPGLKPVSRHSLPAIGSRANISIGPPGAGTPPPLPAGGLPPGVEPMDESAMIPLEQPEPPPMDESSLVPLDEREAEPPATVPVPPPLPPRLPRRPMPRPGSSGVI
jgi:hypothetical protein